MLVIPFRGQSSLFGSFFRMFKMKNLFHLLILVPLRVKSCDFNDYENENFLNFLMGHF